MARIELDLPEDLRAGMVAHPEIEWDVVAVQAIRRELGFLETARRVHATRSER